jgi:hypothetical protein
LEPSVKHSLDSWTRFAVFAGALAFAPATALSQPRYLQVYASDSATLAAPTLSPNGRWIALSQESQAGDAIQIMVVASSGGAPTTITKRGARDLMPVWLPASDGVVFRSSRADDGLMVAPIDAQTGHPKGDLRRLTIEPVQQGLSYAVSPNGREVAYITTKTKGHAYLKVLPAAGGTARTVTEVFAPVAQIYWTSPEAIEYSTVNQSTSEFVVMRVSSRGGNPQLLRHYDQTKGFAVHTPKFALRGARVRINADTLGRVSVVSFGGDTLARFDSKGSSNHSGLNQHLRVSDDGATVTMASAHSRTAVRLASMGGDGTPRPFRATNDTTSVDEPIGFTADSRSVYIINRHQPAPRLEAAPIDGGQSRFWSLPRGVGEVFPTKSGRYAYVADGHSRDSSRTLRSLELATGKLEEISNRVRSRRIIARPDADDVLFAEANGNRLEFRQYGAGRNALIASVDTNHLDPNAGRSGSDFNEHGVVYVRLFGDTARIFGQRGDSPRLIATIVGSVNALALSPNGRMLAYFGVRKESEKRHPFAQLAELDDQFGARGIPKDILGSPVWFDELTWSADNQTLGVGYATAGRADTTLTWSFLATDGTVRRTVEIPHPFAFSEWSTYWSKDNKRVYVLTANDPETRMGIWRISVDPGERPQNVISREGNQVWDSWISPDEKHVVYGPELPAHNVIWRIELPGMATGKP